MRALVLCCIFCGLACPQQQPIGPLINQRIIEFVRAGITSSELQRLIVRAPSVSFDLSPAAEQAMMSAGRHRTHDQGHGCQRVRDGTWRCGRKLGPRDRRQRIPGGIAGKRSTHRSTDSPGSLFAFETQHLRTRQELVLESEVRS